ncbi:SDR family NAD(P)-dependent oxidoreductase [Conexibacter arvalis]|uniref:3-oxoacyl-[acyl-carrier protein] reductase n=1 Tax=Conexibacter arvalis TaxID=912552 RepID=A0A840IA30_9ACTN|nr:SDR family NAD(P)-dependent oxidoreductase [Conexibacter arvalis]MBB4660928.1 3-oxoacyl-[acyl-carrier protein] reductase [Conexibacter arvalis]
MSGQQQRVAVVTGGAAGIGWSIARRLQADGMHVIAADLVEGETPGSGVEWRALDVTDRDAVAALFDAIVSDRGRLDVLVNNAGIQRHGPLVDLTAEEWGKVVDVNLNGVFHCLQAAGRHMLAAGAGAIVNITSIAGERGSPGRAPYSTTKAGVIGLTRAAGVEWAARGVRVNAVGPGYIETGVYHEGVAAGRLDPAAILDRIPADRLGRPEEIAQMVSFLVSDQAAYVNGQVLFVDGGFLADYGVPLAKPS